MGIVPPRALEGARDAGASSGGGAPLAALNGAGVYMFGFAPQSPRRRHGGSVLGFLLGLNALELSVAAFQAGPGPVMAAKAALAALAAAMHRAAWLPRERLAQEALVAASGLASALGLLVGEPGACVALDLALTMSLCLLPSFGRGRPAPAMAVCGVLTGAFGAWTLTGGGGAQDAALALLLCFLGNVVCACKVHAFLSKEELATMFGGKGEPARKEARRGEDELAGSLLLLRHVRSCLGGQSVDELQSKVDRVIADLERQRLRVAGARTGLARESDASSTSAGSGESGSNLSSSNPSLLETEIAGGGDVLSRSLLQKNRQRSFRAARRETVGGNHRVTSSLSKHLARFAESETLSKASRGSDLGPGAAPVVPHAIRSDAEGGEKACRTTSSSSLRRRRSKARGKKDSAGSFRRPPPGNSAGGRGGGGGGGGGPPGGPSRGSSSERSTAQRFSDLSERGSIKSAPADSFRHGSWGGLASSPSSYGPVLELGLIGSDADAADTAGGHGEDGDPAWSPHKRPHQKRPLNSKQPAVYHTGMRRDEAREINNLDELMFESAGKVGDEAEYISEEDDEDEIEGEDDQEAGSDQEAAGEAVGEEGDEEMSGVEDEGPNGGVGLDDRWPNGGTEDGGAQADDEDDDEDADDDDDEDEEAEQGASSEGSGQRRRGTEAGTLLLQPPPPSPRPSEGAVQLHHTWALAPADSEYLREQLLDWNFGPGGIFARLKDPQMPAQFREQPLTTLFVEAIQVFGCDAAFDLDLGQMAGYLRCVESKYLPPDKVQYHNSTHATDVLQATACMLGHEVVRGSLLDPKLSILAALFSAAIHDVAHPGRNEAFHVKTRSELAVLYSDRSVLEHHHLAVAFSVMRARPELDFLALFEEADARLFREKVIRIVLSTDMALHRKTLNKFKELVSSNRPLARARRDGATLLLDAENAAAGGCDKAELSDELHTVYERDCTVILCSIVHSCDISNTAKEWEVYQQWIPHIFLEFFEQGDEERRLGFAVGLPYDREACRPCQMQSYFIDLFVKEYFGMLSTWCPDIGEMLYPNLHRNRKLLKEKEDLKIDEMLRDTAW